MINQTKLKFILFFSFFVIAGNIAVCQLVSNIPEWKSPHTLHDLSSTPVAIIPFPQQVPWMNNKW